MQGHGRWADIRTELQLGNEGNWVSGAHHPSVQVYRVYTVSALVVGSRRLYLFTRTRLFPLCSYAVKYHMTCLPFRTSESSLLTLLVPLP